MILGSLKDSARIDALNQLGNAFIDINIDTAAVLAGRALSEASKLNYIHGMAEAKSLQGDIVFLSVRTAKTAIFRKHDYKEAETLARAAIQLYTKTTNKKRLNKTHHLLAHSLYAQGQFAEAITNFDTSIELSKQAGDSTQAFYSTRISAYVHLDAGDYKKAFEKAQEMHQLAAGKNGTIVETVTLILIGDLYATINDFKNALSYHRKALKLPSIRKHQQYQMIAKIFNDDHQFDSAKYYYDLADTVADLKSLQFYLAGMGEYYLFQRQFDKALPLFVRSLHYFKAVEDRNQTMRALINIAKTHFGLQHAKTAYGFVHETLAMARELNSKLFLRDSYKLLYLIHREQKPDSALFYHEEFINMEKVINSAQVEAKLLTFNFDQKIRLLEREKEIQKSKLQRASFLRKALVAGILLFVSLGVFVFRNIVLKRKTEKQKREMAEGELQRQKLESEKTKAELEHQATELEMQALRAQMNPHFIFNSLNSINRFILQNNKLQASEYLTKFSRLVRLILQNSQAALTPLESEIEALQLYLELEKIRFDHQFEFSIHVDDELDPEIIRVPPLIIQPYAENAIWHGLMHKEEKGHLEIEIFNEGDLLCFKIMDDGIGRKKAAELKGNSAPGHKSMGMRITADRIAILQQQSLDSNIVVKDLASPDGTPAGTEVLIKIPIRHN